MIVDSIWDEVSPGMYVQDAQLVLWRVDDERDGWHLLVDARGACQAIPPMPADRPVRIWRPTTAEALAVLSKALGPLTMLNPDTGEEITLPPTDPARSAFLRMETRAAQPERARRRAAPYIPEKSPAGTLDIASHLWISHGDMPQSGARRVQLIAQHDSLHEEAAAGRHLMSRPHHHEEPPCSPALPAWARPVTTSARSQSPSAR